MNNFRDSLLLWHKKNHRVYPWRTSTSPYTIMIAEFMLQRTRADQVVPVYCLFLEKYPDVPSLAKSNLEDLKMLLKPLGLYWRAGHFKKAAEFIQREYAGVIPSEPEELLKIPGVGDYVCGAILAVAFSKKSCIVDSNIARVLNRYYGLGLTGEIRRRREIEELSKELFNYDDPKEVLFAIIDFSALICTPSNPKHGVCPLKATCKFNQQLTGQP